jgi:diadenylate cyclase
LNMHLIAIIDNLRFQDVLDILFLSVVAYHLYLWFYGSKALKALVGLLALGVAFTLARTWGLFMTTWVFQIFWQVLVLLLIILFQSEIRQVLERVNPLKAIGFRKFATPDDWIPGFVKAIFSLAAKRIGALIIIERIDQVKEWITAGQSLEGDPTPELLTSIFQKDSPLHDGAVIIRDGRIKEVACYLPLSPDEGLPKEWGTRHRAALGLSERCDAWVVVVSEERGDISFAREGQMVHVDSQEKFSQMVKEAVIPHSIPRKKWWERIRFFLVHRWRTKLGTVVLVSLLWLLLAGQQDFEKTISVPLEIKNLPDKMEIVEPLEPTVQITVRGIRKDSSSLNGKNVLAKIDLSMARFGRRIFPITRDQILLPNDRIQVVKIDPPKLEFTLKEKP